MNPEIRNITQMVVSKMQHKIKFAEKIRKHSISFACMSLHSRESSKYLMATISL